MATPRRFGGPAAIIAATALMALQDAVIKLLSGDLPLWQLFFLRSAIVIPLLLIIVARQGRGELRAAVAPWALLRSVLIVAMYVAFYAAVPYALSAITTRGKIASTSLWTLNLSLNLVFVVVGSLGMGRPQSLTGPTCTRSSRLRGRL